MELKGKFTSKRHCVPPKKIVHGPNMIHFSPSLNLKITAIK